MYKTVVMLACMAILGGCATYTTPGAGVAVSALASPDQDIAAAMATEPTATFPTRLALARVQAPGYVSDSAACFGKGRYCVLAARDVESDDDLKRLTSLHGVAAAMPVNRLLLPNRLDSIKALRLAAARLKADMLVVYTLDTRFTVDSKPLGPLAAVSLGFIKNKNARVTTTASAAIFDVRTEFVYGLAEYSASTAQEATIWSSSAVIDTARSGTEQEAFTGLLSEVEKLWPDIVREHALGPRGAL